MTSIFVGGVNTTQTNQVINRTVTTSTTLLQTDAVVFVNQTGAVTLTLPSSPLAGQQITVKDGGTGATNNITITPASGTIDGAAAVIIQGNYGAVTLDWTGSAWTIIASTGSIPSLLLSSAQQTASYTLALSDLSTVVEMNSTSAMNVTIPTNVSVAFPVGTTIEIFQMNTGQVTIVAAGGVTLLTATNTVTSRAQYSTLLLRQRAANIWVLSGDLT